MIVHGGADDEPKLNAEQIARIIPRTRQMTVVHGLKIYTIFQSSFGIPQNKENMCSIIAVVDQESLNFVADPQVYGLGEKAVKEVQDRLDEKFKDKLGDAIGSTFAGYFQQVLKSSQVLNNYLSQMRRVKTERELDELYP